MKIKPSNRKGIDKQIEVDKSKKQEYGEQELNPDNCIENIGEFDVRKFELDYWNNLKLEAM